MIFLMETLLPLLDIKSEYVLDIYDIYELVEFIQSLDIITKEKVEDFIGDISARKSESTSVFADWISYHDENLVKCMYLLSKCTFEILQKILNGNEYKGLIVKDLVTVLVENPIGFFICFSDSSDATGKQTIYNALNSARLYILRNLTQGEVDDFIGKYLVEKGIKL